VNLKDAAPLGLNNASACGENPLFIKVGLRRRDVTIVESNSLFPLRKNFGNVGRVFRIFQLDFHHLYFIATPELFLSGPLVSRRPSLFFKGMIQREKISPLSAGIESRAEGVFESVQGVILTLDPENHRGLQRIQVEEPSSKFHKITCRKIA
jgi:hypothetical protein